MSTMERKGRPLIASLTLIGALAAGCGGSDPPSTAPPDGAGNPDEPATTIPAAPLIDPGDGGNYHPALDPAGFVDLVDNPYMPLTPGSVWIYEGISDGELEHVEVVVTPERREILGISAVVVRDTVSVDGEVVEDTFDWFAQDGEGNVWYLGEASTDYADGRAVSTEGSWEAGVDGAQPGIVMPAQPQVGHAYRQEFYEGEAEDVAEILSTTAEVTTGLGSWSDVVVTREWNPLEPEVVEEKSYAAGVGMVLEDVAEGGEGHLELISFTAAS